jgi:DNA-directed RNA polymerase specialized sigma subunit
MDNGHDSSNYVGIDLFRRTLPVFKKGLEAKDRLAKRDGTISRSEKVKLRRLATLGDAAYQEVCDACEWMVNRAVRKELNRPRSFHVIMNDEDLRQAGFEAVFKMMKTADLSKMHGSAVNYLMQWISTNVSRAALKDEAEFGMSSSKLVIMRKIAAVRARLGKTLGRTATDDEVYEFLQSGAADMKTMYGRSDGSSKHHANDKISLDMIHDQSRLNSGTPMKFAVTDPIAIDAEVNSEDLGVSDYDAVLEPPTKTFWTSWMKHVGISEKQWDVIAILTGIYDTGPDIKRPRRAARLVNEFYMLVGSKTGAINLYAKQWSKDHGPGQWDVFSDIELSDEIPIHGVDKNGSPLFNVLKINRETEE